MDHAELFKEIRKIEIVTRSLVNDRLAGQYQSVFKGRGMAFDEVRQYELGDDVRLIDWNVSARMNAPYVKIFVEEREMTVMLVVDASASELFGTARQTKAKLAAKLAATLAFSAIKNNDRVGLVMFTDRVELFVPPKKGKKHVLRVISEILRFQPTGRGTDLAIGLDYLCKVAKHRSVAFLLSDFLAEGWERSLRLAKTKHDLVPICVVDPREEEMTDVGVVYVEDPESGAVVPVDTTSRRVREAYAEAMRRRRAERERLFRRHRIDFVNISTTDADMSALVNFFQIRARRAMRG
jgi:uncharacterized protein (DUF58 family)